MKQKLEFVVVQDRRVPCNLRKSLESTMKSQSRVLLACFSYASGLRRLGCLFAALGRKSVKLTVNCSEKLGMMTLCARMPVSSWIEGLFAKVPPDVHT